ncbi:MAG: SurA N-terminal domain-containing protein [Xanthobacteraceae bacterium]
MPLRPTRKRDCAMMFVRRMTSRALVLAAMLAMLSSMAASTARAQQVIAMVNGEPITALDIEQRTKFHQLSGSKAPARQEVLDELINEKLKVREARRWGLEVTDAEVESAVKSMASRMRFTSDQLAQHLAKSGVNIATLKHRIRSDLAWPQIVRGRYSSVLQVGEKDILTAMDSKTEDVAGFDYTLRPILFLVPAGSSESFIEGRKREAEALRARFQSCEEGIAFTRALRDVAIREQVIRSSADLPAELRKVLDGIEVGHLTAPEVTKLGVETFAMCAKKPSSADNSIGKRKAKETIMAERYEQVSKRYLTELRRSAMIEYK